MSRKLRGMRTAVKTCDGQPSFDLEEILNA